jgi:heat shock protein HslJ
MTRFPTLALVPFGLTLLVAGCQRRAGSTDRPDAEPLITDRQWSLRELDGQPLDSAARSSPPTLLLATSSTQASGFAGCNRMAGSYKLGPGTLELGPLVLTGMACPSMDLEARYTGALDRARQYRVDGNRLELLADGTVLATFEPSPSP